MFAAFTSAVASTSFDFKLFKIAYEFESSAVRASSIVWWDVNSALDLANWPSISTDLVLVSSTLDWASFNSCVACDLYRSSLAWASNLAFDGVTIFLFDT